MTSHQHPYIPKDLNLPDYVPNSLNHIEIVFPYLGSSLFIIAAIWILSGRFPKLSKADRLLMCWWAFSGLTHIILEGYFVFVPDFYKRKAPFYLDEVWKEYSKGDSRYVGRDAAVIAVEGITAAIEGPACLLAVYAIARSKSYSCILQFGICLGQLYGCIVYFVTSILDGDNFSSSPYYYWVYYIGANCSWVIFPALIALRSWNRITAAAFESQEKHKIN